MAQITAEQIIAGILGPPVVIGGAEILGPNEGRLLDAIRARVAAGVLHFTITWGSQAQHMPREMRAGAALEILESRHRRTAVFPRRRPQFDVGEMFAGG